MPIGRPRNGKASELLFVCLRQVTRRKNGKASELWGRDLETMTNGPAPEHKVNHEFTLEAVGQNEHVFVPSIPEHRTDCASMFEAVRQNRYAPVYAAPECKNDREIRLEAMTQIG